MKSIRTLIPILVVTLGFMSANASTKIEEMASNNEQIAGNTMPQDSVLRHVVLFKFKSETTAEQLKQIEDTFGDLSSKIKEIVDYEWGLNNSPEGLDKGFTHCFFITFKNEKDRDAYLPHPDHKAFVELASPHIEDVLVMDYWTRSP
ncbi:Dabb family protein [Flagellimonas myxillae]|uniref:Dabb family protein n=1 Tax=Flagellimonas myxillae TaxID=2942214 RepID=UPI00201E9306|nr:Dabb family protein [Muricauda myxillae]MCL6265432.1 Dabb family protein [Muricauda myxillae]